MADDTDQQGAADRNQVAAGEGYEVAYFAKKHGMTQKAARDLIAEIGNDRGALDAAAMARGPATKRAKKAKPETPKAEPKAGSAKPARRRTAAPSPVEKVVAVAAPAIAVATKPIKARAKAVKRSVVDAVTPASEAAVPAAKAIADRAKAATATARARAAAAPAAVSKKAGKAIDATKAAATGRTAALVGAVAAGLVTGLAVNIGRKAVVQAPSVMAGDWFEALKAEHKAALAIFDQIEKTSEAEPAKRNMLLIQLTHALGKHAFTEENVVYPALRDWGDKADADKLNHDHGYVKQYLYELDELDNAAPVFLARVAVFRADLEAHIREEEDAIFPPLHAALDDAKNAHITALANREGFKLA